MNIRNAIQILLVLGLTLPLLASAQITTRPSYDDFPIDIVWETETYTPSSFEGKPLAIKGSSVRVTALVPTENIKNIEFSWIIKDISSPFSGIIKKERGDNTYSFITERIIPGFVHEIELIAKNVFTGELAKSKINIRLVRPEIHLHSSDTKSLFRKVIDTFPGDIAEIIAQPFYFNSLSLDNLSFSWLFDKKEYNDADEPNILILNVSRETGIGTEKSLKIAVENKNSSRENAQSTTKLFVKPR